MSMLHISRRLDNRPVRIHPAKDRTKLFYDYTGSPFASFYVIVIMPVVPLTSPPKNAR